MGSRVPSAVGCFPELCFHLFSVAQVLVGLRTQFINNFVLPAWACAAGFNNNNNNNTCPPIVHKLMLHAHSSDYCIIHFNSWQHSQIAVEQKNVYLSYAFFHSLTCGPSVVYIHAVIHVTDDMRKLCNGGRLIDILQSNYVKI